MLGMMFLPELTFQRSFLKRRPYYGPFAIERGETAKKIFFELMLFLDIFQYKNHIWHINKNFIFLAVSSLSTAKGPIIINLSIQEALSCLSKEIFQVRLVILLFNFFINYYYFKYKLIIYII